MLHADIVSDLDVMSEQDAELGPAPRHHGGEGRLAASGRGPAGGYRGRDERHRGGRCRGRRPRPAFGARRILYCENVFARYPRRASWKATRPCATCAPRHRSGGPLVALAHLPRHGRFGCGRGPGPRLHRTGPTSAPAYNDLITCFAEGDHYDRIIDVARMPLRVAVTGNDIAYVYYRLAFAYWQTGRLPEAFGLLPARAGGKAPWARPPCANATTW